MRSAVPCVLVLYHLGLRRLHLRKITTTQNSVRRGVSVATQSRHNAPHAASNTWSCVPVLLAFPSTTHWVGTKDRKQTTRSRKKQGDSPRDCVGFGESMHALMVCSLQPTPCAHPTYIDACGARTRGMMRQAVHYCEYVQARSWLAFLCESNWDRDGVANALDGLDGTGPPGTCMLCGGWLCVSRASDGPRCIPRSTSFSSRVGQQSRGGPLSQPPSPLSLSPESRRCWRVWSTPAWCARNARTAQRFEHPPGAFSAQSSNILEVRALHKRRTHHPSFFIDLKHKVPCDSILLCWV